MTANHDDGTRHCQRPAGGPHVDHRQSQSLLSGYNVTADQYVLLALLNIEDGITQQELTRRASSDPNTVRSFHAAVVQRLFDFWITNKR